MMVKGANVLSTVAEYFFSGKLKEISALKASGKEVINLGIGNPVGMPPSDVIEMLREEVGKPDVHGYQSYKGSVDLLQAMQRWYEYFFKVDSLSEDNFLVLNGSKEGISYILHAFVNAGEEVLVPNPGYPAYSSVAQLFNARVKTYDLLQEKDFYPDFSQVEGLITEKTKVIFLNYPAMPTGSKAQKDIFQGFVHLALKHKILLVHDNPYSVFQDEPLSIFSVPQAKEIAIELNSLSKTFNMAGWRVGMAVAHSEYIAKLLVIRSNNSPGLFLPIQRAAARALSVPNQWYENLRREYEVKRELVEAALREMEFLVSENQVGMFVWARVPEIFVSGTEASDFFLNEAGVFLTEGRIFGNNGKNFLRISLCADVDILSRAMEKMYLSIRKFKYKNIK